MLTNQLEARSLGLLVALLLGQSNMYVPVLPFLIAPVELVPPYVDVVQFEPCVRESSTCPTTSQIKRYRPHNINITNATR